MKPKLLIASSHETRDLLSDIAAHFVDAEVMHWWKTLEPSRTSLSALFDDLRRADFAIVLFGPEDVAKLRAPELAATRDPVIFEMGLFLGRLGLARCSLLIAETTPENIPGALRLPAELAGMHWETYDPRPQECKKSLRTACQSIRRRVNASQKLGDRIEGDWVEIKDSPKSPFALLRFWRKTDGSLGVEGTSYYADGQPHVNWPHSIDFSLERPTGVLHCYDAQHHDADSGLSVAHGMTSFTFNEDNNTGNGHYISYAEGTGMDTGRVSFRLKRLTPEYLRFLLGSRFKKSSPTPPGRNRALIQELSKLHRVRKFVLTGGPGSGKSELLRMLQKACPRAAAIDEAATRIMRKHINDKLRDPELFPAWRSQNMSDFQQEVFKEQRKLENALPHDCEVAFLDRSGIDGIAYLEREGLKPSPEMLTYAREMVFSAVFVLETPPTGVYQVRPETGRHSTRSESAEMGDRLAEIYAAFGHSIQRISADLSFKEMAALIRANLDQQADE